LEAAMSDADRATWWDLAKRLGAVRNLVIAVDPREIQLTCDPGLVRFFRARWGRRTRAGLDGLGPVFASMLALSRGPAPLFPVSPEELETWSLDAIIGCHDCLRALRADASYQHELGRDGACVERIEAMVGLARHALGRSESIWVLKGAMFLQSACSAVRVFDVAVRNAPAERARLRTSLLRVEELNPSPWPELLGADVRARATFPDHEWQKDTVVGIVRQDLRKTIAGIEAMG
jgi:hypothetical protein